MWKERKTANMKTGDSAPKHEARQAGETRREERERLAISTKPRPRSSDWVERSVWTDRMLDTLKRGVKGGKWFSLVDKLYAPANLTSAWTKVRGNKGAPGIDRQTVADFNRCLDHNLQRLGEALRRDLYEPMPVRRCWIDKPGSKEKRPLGIPAVRDRVVQTALRSVLEPIFEYAFNDNSYGFRPGRSCRDALRVVDQSLREGYNWVVDADLKGYFDSIPHERLLERVSEKVSDGRILELIGRFLKTDVMEGMSKWTPEEGAPQGGVISPLLANIYLDPLDWLMDDGPWRYVRYADDLVLLCRSEEDALKALEQVRRWTESAGLELHPEKTRIVGPEAEGGFEFLGYRFAKGKKFPRKKSETKLRKNIARLTRRCNGHSMERTIGKINPVLRGWFNYFKHAYKTTFPDIDGWVRMRLRSILRKRRGERGRGRGEDHKRWPNIYFERLGLYSTAKTHTRLLSPYR